MKWKNVHIVYDLNVREFLDLELFLYDDDDDDDDHHHHHHYRL